MPAVGAAALAGRGVLAFPRTKQANVPLAHQHCPTSERFHGPSMVLYVPQNYTPQGFPPGVQSSSKPSLRKKKV